MNGKTRPLGSLEVYLEQPTEFNFADLGDWVLWQFPRSRKGWLCGAARPPQPADGWIPARIKPLKQRVLLYAHRSESHASPEEAAEWIANLAE